jgi:hypothetical protein
VTAGSNACRRCFLSDESGFGNSGTVIRHNIHHWSVDTRHWARQTAFQILCGAGSWETMWLDHTSSRAVLMDIGICSTPERPFTVVRRDATADKAPFMVPAWPDFVASVGELSKPPERENE